MLTDYTNNMILDGLFGGKSIDIPKIIRFGLSRSWANPSGSILEPESKSYYRVTIHNDFDLFNVAKFGTKTNRLAIQFPKPSDRWGLIVSVFLMDEHSNVLSMGDLDKPRMIDAESPAPLIGIENILLLHR